MLLFQHSCKEKMTKKSIKWITHLNNCFFILGEKENMSNKKTNDITIYGTFFFALFGLITSYKSIKQDFVIEHSSPKIEVEVGTPGQRHPIQLSLSYPRSWVSPAFYKVTESSTSKKIKEKVQFPSNITMNMEGFEVTDLYVINQTIIENFDFFVLRSGIVFQFGIISLAHNFEDEKHSLIHTLKNRLLIDYSSFGFSFEDGNKGKMYFGKFPEEDFPNYFHSSCQLDERKDRSKDFWSCNLQKVILEYKGKEFSYSNENRYSHFSLSSRIYAPDEFLSFLEKNQFYEAIKNNECQLSGLKEFECNPEVIETFGDLYFVFNNVGYKIKNEDLWTQKKSLYEYRISGGYKVYSGFMNDWYIGISFLKDFNIEFDYEEQKINFYSNRNKIKLLNWEIIVQRIYVCIILFNILGTILLSYMLLHKTFFNN